MERELERECEEPCELGAFARGSVSGFFRSFRVRVNKLRRVKGTIVKKVIAFKRSILVNYTINK
jgi:hypothetical protein